MHALLVVLTDQSMLNSCFPSGKENMSNGCEFDLLFPCSEKGIIIKRGCRSAVARSRQIVYLNTLNEVHVYTKFLEIFCEPIYLIGNCTQLKAVLLVNGFKKLFLFPFNATT